MANLDVLKELLARKVEVELPTGTVELTVPKEIDVIFIHGLFFSDEEKLSKEDRVKRSIEIAAKVIMACIPEIKKIEQAKQILFVTGGPTGDLAQEAMRMCGLLGGGKRDAPELDRPT